MASDHIVPICVQTGQAMCRVQNGKRQMFCYGMLNDADRAWREREHYHTPHLPYYYFFDDHIFNEMKGQSLARGMRCDEVPRGELQYHIPSLRIYHNTLHAHAPSKEVLPVVAGEALCAAGSLLPNSVAMLKLRSESGTPADFVRYFVADMMPAIRRAMGDRMIVTKPWHENDCGVSNRIC